LKVETDSGDQQVEEKSVELKRTKKSKEVAKVT
jgi:hypothetical protein